MKVVCVVQARMGSTRLPGKVLLDISGRPMLDRVIERLSFARTLDAVMIATTTLERDDVVAARAAAIGTPVFRGDEADVLGRYVGAAQASEADLVVRVTSDCPLVDPEVLDLVVTALRESAPRAAFAANVIERTYPRGMDVEAVWRDDLLRLNQMATSPFDREHVFPYVYGHPGEFPSVSVADAVDRSSMRWTVDTPEDLEFVRRVWQVMGNDRFGWRDVLAATEKIPQ
jgi:spore coat polysaccharide biosynthesis protein SpsF